jgi:HEAT repeat protein
MLDDESAIVRHESAVALSSLGDQNALSQLEKAIADKDEDVRNSALIAWEYLSYLRKKGEARDSVSPKSKIRL